MRDPLWWIDYLFPIGTSAVICFVWLRLNRRSRIK